MPDFSHSIVNAVLPNRAQWFECEANRQLLESRKQTVSTFLRLCMGLVLVFEAPKLAVIAWLVLSFSANAWMQHFIARYNTALNTGDLASSPQILQIVKNYKTAWIVNALIWGLSSYLFINYLSFNAQLVGLVIANALAFLFITRTSVDVTLMNRVSSILILSQLVFAALHITTIEHSQNEFVIYSIYVFYLLFTWYLLRIVGLRFNRLHKKHWESEYAKLELIEQLKQNQKRLNAEHIALAQADTVIQRFYSDAAHDLRQPVYAMQLYIEMLREDPKLTANLLPKIDQSCESINSMFNALFDFQKIHAEDMQLEIKKVSIQDVFKKLALNFEPIAKAKNLKLHFKLLAGTVTIAPLYLNRILSNLITNGIRYTSNGGLLVGVRKTSEHINFEIWDTGIGIEEAVQQHIFNEFFKVNAPNADSNGLGLGLSIVNQLVARIDGAKITLKSRPGHGSVFKFQLPIAQYSAD